MDLYRYQEYEVEIGPDLGLEAPGLIEFLGTFITYARPSCP